MDSQQIINEEYRVLCQRRGHLQNNLDKVNEELSGIVARIAILNEANEVLEKATAAAAEAAQRAAAIKKELSEE